MRLRPLIALAFAVILLPSCIKRIDPTDGMAVAKAIEVKHDAFAKTTTYTAPNAAENPYSQKIYLVAHASERDGTTSYRLAFTDYRMPDWNFYETAWDSDGNQLPARVLDRKVDECFGDGNCQMTERLMIDLSREYLERHQDGGLNMRVVGKKYHRTFQLPSAYIKAFLAKLN